MPKRCLLVAILLTAGAVLTGCAGEGKPLPSFTKGPDLICAGTGLEGLQVLVIDGLTYGVNVDPDSGAVREAKRFNLVWPAGFRLLQNGDVVDEAGAVFARDRVVLRNVEVCPGAGDDLLIWDPRPLPADS